MTTHLGDGIVVDASFLEWMPVCALAVLGLRTNFYMVKAKSRFLRKIIYCLCYTYLGNHRNQKSLKDECLWEFILATVISFGCVFAFQFCL